MWSGKDPTHDRRSRATATGDSCAGAVRYGNFTDIADAGPQHRAQDHVRCGEAARDLLRAQRHIDKLSPSGSIEKRAEDPTGQVGQDANTATSRSDLFEYRLCTGDRPDNGPADCISHGPLEG